MLKADPKILDCTCGSRSIWFDKDNKYTLYTDIREEEHHGVFGKEQRKRDMYVRPDMIVDFTEMPFEDESFSMVVYDPPHVRNLSESSWTRKMYGTLDENWKEILRGGFKECMRVLKEDGVLIFKWSEIDIPAAELWEVIGETPLFGHHSGRKMNTYWGVFMKGNPANINYRQMEIL